MTEKLTAIVLDITRHNDKLNVITLYTRSRGRLSFLSPVGSGKNGRLRQARLQPLAVIETDINFRNNIDLHRLGKFAYLTVWRDIYFNPVKQMMALFLSEFLNKLLRATMPDENLWDYIFSSLELFDNMQNGIANFHIVFLSSLLPFVGIQPDFTNFHPGDLFDMQSGTFKTPHITQVHNHNYTSTFPANASGSNNFCSNENSLILTEDESRMATILCKVNFSNSRALRLTGEMRYKILRRLLQYYSCHFPGAGNIKSLDIIHEIFQ